MTVSTRVLRAVMRGETREDLSLGDAVALVARSRMRDRSALIASVATRRSTTPTTRVAALMELDRVPSAQATRALRRALASSERSARFVAGSVLARAGTARDIPPVRQWVGDLSRARRKRGANLLQLLEGRFGAEAAHPTAISERELVAHEELPSDMRREPMVISPLSGRPARAASRGMAARVVGFDLARRGFELRCQGTNHWAVFPRADLAETLAPGHVLTVAALGRDDMHGGFRLDSYVVFLRSRTGRGQVKLVSLDGVCFMAGPLRTARGRSTFELRSVRSYLEVPTTLGGVFENGALTLTEGETAVADRPFRRERFPRESPQPLA